MADRSEKTLENLKSLLAQHTLKASTTPLSQRNRTMNTQNQSNTQQSQQQADAPAQSSVIDFDSDEPLACPMRKDGDEGTCEACQ